jgi:hypothetical protein
MTATAWGQTGWFVAVAAIGVAISYSKSTASGRHIETEVDVR